jgi:hypothetical protein
MRRRRGALPAVLLYVPLDLSVPATPGAFVFESADSLEISSHRVRENKADAPVLRAPARDPVVVSEPPVDPRERVAATSKVWVLGRPVLNRLARTTLDPAPPSEDPQ